jgi:hypothetical protein
LDPLQWWDHRSEKVTEHKSCQSSYVNGAIALVGVNVVALSRLKVGAALGFKVYSNSIYVWDVENTWLISLIWISGYRPMKGTRITNIRRQRKHSGLRTNETRHG